MNLSAKRNELIILISGYLNNQYTLTSLQKFAWDIIDYFNVNKKTELPPYQSFEKEFWYAIWQIQHLADEEHEHEGVTKKVLTEALEYLQKKKNIPNDYEGKRP